MLGLCLSLVCGGVNDSHSLDTTKSWKLIMIPKGFHANILRKGSWGWLVELLLRFKMVHADVIFWSYKILNFNSTRTFKITFWNAEPALFHLIITIYEYSLPPVHHPMIIYEYILTMRSLDKYLSPETFPLLLLIRRHYNFLHASPFNILTHFRNLFDFLLLLRSRFPIARHRKSDSATCDFETVFRALFSPSSLFPATRGSRGWTSCFIKINSPSRS